MEKILETVEKVVGSLAKQPNVHRPGADKIKKEAEKHGKKTEFGNYNFTSTVKNRSAGLTVYIGSDRVKLQHPSKKQMEMLEQAPHTIEKVHHYLKHAPLVYTSRFMGNNPEFVFKCHLFVSVARPEMMRLVHMVSQTLFQNKPKSAKHKDIYIVHIPEWQEKDRQILVFPEIDITYVLGSDYYGEDKKGFLRMGMWEAKQIGMLGLHAGSKLIRARDKDGSFKNHSMLILGLTATGKTTHSCHDHGLNFQGETIQIAQDDIIFLKKNGATLGTETGFYLKTEGLAPDTQPLIYKAATQKSAILENAFVDYKGKVYFDDTTLTGNGRGIMLRKEFGKFTSKTVNTPPLSELDGLIVLFITRRNTIVPAVSKLNKEQAAAFFMLGESIESSGGDPAKAGQSVREVGTNPFIVGDFAEEGNIFYEFLKNMDRVQCYLMNTGGVGEITKAVDNKRIAEQKLTKIGIPESAAIIRGICRNTIRWKNDPHFGTQVPEHVEGIDISQFNPARFYTKEKLEELVNQLRQERKEYLAKFKGLGPEIVNAFK